MQARLAVAALAAVAAVTTQFATAQGQVAPVTGDCAEPYPVADLVAGADVTGLTVSRGTAPEGFTGEVLGVVSSGIAPGLDLVMARLSSPEIDRVGGIWSGMSGSPVYATDGRLIGAVAYGLAWGSTPVAGLTPFEEMDDYTALAPRVPVSIRTARMLAEAAGVSVAQAAQGFKPLPVVMGVSGVRADRLAFGGRPYLDPEAVAAGTAGVGVAGPDTIVAGGNLGYLITFGDISMGGVGTVTTRCGETVIGFGHPVEFTGPTTAALSPAEAVYVQEDPLGVPFKVFNLGPPAGTYSQDRLTGATGTVGPIPAVVDVESVISNRGRSRSAASHVAVPTPFNIASTTWYQMIANHDRVLDRRGPGTADEAWTITGTRASGKPFTVDFGQTYLSGDDIGFDVSWQAADLAYLVSALPGVTTTAVELTSSVNDDPGVWTLVGVERNVDGTWVTLKSGATVRARAGTTLGLRARLTRGDRQRTVWLPLELPARLSGASGNLRVEGGEGSFDPWWMWESDSLSEMQSHIRHMIRNDQVNAAVELVRDGRLVYFRNQPTHPLGRVVRTGHGDLSFNFVVR